MFSLSKLVLFSIGIGVLCGPAPAEAIVLTPDEGKCRVLGFFPTEIQAPAEGELLQDLLPDYARWTREETRRISHSNMATDGVPRHETLPQPRYFSRSRTQGSTN